MEIFIIIYYLNILKFLETLRISQKKFLVEKSHKILRKIRQNFQDQKYKTLIVGTERLDNS